MNVPQFIQSNKHIMDGVYDKQGLCNECGTHKAVVNYNGPIEAPIKKDDIVGKLKISYKDEIIVEHDLLAYENIKKVNIFSRLIKSFNYLIWGDV